MRYLLFIGTLFLFLVIMGDPSCAATLRFDDQNFTIDVPDDFKKQTPPSPNVIYFAKNADSTRSVLIYSLSGSTDVTGTEFIDGFRKGAISKGSRLKESTVETINGQSFLVTDLIQSAPQGLVDGATYIISADNHILLICDSRSPSTGDRLTKDPGSIALIQSFKFINPPALPTDKYYNAGYVVGTVVGVAVIIAIPVGIFIAVVAGAIYIATKGRR